MPTTKLHDLDVEEFLSQCVTVDPMALSEEFVRLPSDFAYWNERHAKAQRLLASAKAQREAMYSALLLSLRAAEAEEPQLDPGKKTKAPKAKTVAEIDAAINTDNTFKVAKGAESDAEIEVERLNNLLHALRHKKDMLMQLGFQQRAEMASDPILRDYVQGERSKRDGF